MSRHILLSLLIVSALALLLAACGGSAAPTTAPSPTQAGPITAPTQIPSAFDQEWNALIEAARAEGELQNFICCGLGRASEELLQTFEKQFGVKVIRSTGSSNQQVGKVEAERKAGKYTLDVWHGGTSTATTRLLPGGMIQPLEPLLIRPDVLDPSKWYKNQLWWSDPADRQYVFSYGGNGGGLGVAYNTNLLPDPRVIQSYSDIVGPQFQGKIVIRDPRDAGTQNQLPFYFVTPGLLEGFLKPLLTKGTATIAPDATVAAEWLALGKYTLCFFACSTEVQKAKEQGLPVEPSFPHALKEGQSLSTGADNLYAVDTPPHPNAQKLFINWFLSPEGQVLYQKATLNDSLRIDIPKDAVDPNNLRQPGIDYVFLQGDARYPQQLEEAVAWARQYLGDQGL